MQVNLNNSPNLFYKGPISLRNQKAGEVTILLNPTHGEFMQMNRESPFRIVRGILGAGLLLWSASKAPHRDIRGLLIQLKRDHVGLSADLYANEVWITLDPETEDTGTVEVAAWKRWVLRNPIIRQYYPGGYRLTLRLPDGRILEEAMS